MKEYQIKEQAIKFNDFHAENLEEVKDYQSELKYIQNDEKSQKNLVNYIHKDAKVDSPEVKI